MGCFVSRRSSSFCDCFLVVESRRDEKEGTRSVGRELTFRFAFVGLYHIQRLVGLCHDQRPACSVDEVQRETGDDGFVG